MATALFNHSFSISMRQHLFLSARQKSAALFQQILQLILQGNNEPKDLSFASLKEVHRSVQ